MSSSSPSPSEAPSSVPAPTAVGTLPACCTEAFKEYYRRGEVPQFGCYDPIYLRQAFDTPSTLKHTSENPMHASFFPPFSSLVRAYAVHDTASFSSFLSGDIAGEPAVTEGANVDDAVTSAANRARPLQSWVQITSVEDMWNGPPLTTKIPPASDYERILLDRAP
ncbi:hypothetical protein JKF63_02233 [Porcisia hertigi]|uniref:Uncharacterized protein n=1 Tax=Porcisia hertigi TaxID=2761500 RepID=A0A836IIB6_9TRYP|nr:hypothetical protein JKF63_02233 [Porcisia hertigi]